MALPHTLRLKANSDRLHATVAAASGPSAKIVLYSQHTGVARPTIASRFKACEAPFYVNISPRQPIYMIAMRTCLLHIDDIHLVAGIKKPRH
eukprot:6394220-Prymnesium_polylepis.1